MRLARLSLLSLLVFHAALAVSAFE
jgi:hypothetical protein